MIDLFGHVPEVPPDADTIVAFLESKGIRRKINRQQAKTMLKRWTLDQIIAGVVLGCYRASLSGAKPTRLNYFDWSVADAVAAGPDYVAYLVNHG